MNNSEALLINGKPASAYKYVFIVAQNYEEEIGVCALPNGNMPATEPLISILETAARTMHSQLVIAATVTQVGNMFQKVLDSDVIKLRKKVEELETKLKDNDA